MDSLTPILSRRSQFSMPGLCTEEIVRQNTALKRAAGTRIEEKATSLAAALRGCSPREIEMLVLYYVSGYDETAVLRRTGGTVEEFARLRRELRRRAAAPHARAAAG